MRISQERIIELQKILKEEYNLDYTDEQAQEAGLSIVRFVLIKESNEIKKV